MRVEWYKKEKLIMKVSVIIPAYNIEDYIGKCLDSVLSQDFDQSQMEIIVIDDGSTDKTGEVIDNYASKHNLIRPIHKKNEGVSAARNDGIEAANGEYIFFFDGDDFQEKETCRELIEIADRESADAVIYGYHRFEDGKVYETNYPRFDKTIYEGDTIIKEVMPAFIGLSNKDINNWIAGKPDSLYVENPALWRILCKKSVIKDNNLQFDTTLKVGEDTCFISEYLSCCKKVYIQQKCYYYLVTRSTSAIYRYEREPMSKLEGKKRLNDARERLVKRIKERSGVNVTKTFAGTIVMSAVEVAFRLSEKDGKHSRKERYEAYRSFVDDKRVRKLIQGFKIGRGSVVKRIPFIFLKKGWFGLLFLATEMLHVVGYEFKR